MYITPIVQGSCICSLLSPVLLEPSEAKGWRFNELHEHEGRMWQEYHRCVPPQ